MSEQVNEQQLTKEQIQGNIDHLVSWIRDEIEEVCNVKKGPYYVYDVTAFRLHQGLDYENWLIDDLRMLKGFVELIVNFEFVVSDIEFTDLDLIYKYEVDSVSNESEQRKVTPFEEVSELLAKINTTIETLKTTDSEYFEAEDMFKLSKKATELSQVALNVAIQIVDTIDKQ